MQRQQLVHDPLHQRMHCLWAGTGSMYLPTKAIHPRARSKCACGGRKTPALSDMWRMCTGSDVGEKFKKACYSSSNLERSNEREYTHVGRCVSIAAELGGWGEIYARRTIWGQFFFFSWLSTYIVELSYYFFVSCVGRDLPGSASCTSQCFPGLR